MNGKESFIKARNKFVRTRMMVFRSMGYVSLVNFMMILFLTISQVDERNFLPFNISDYTLLVWAFGLFMLVFVGYLDMYVFRNFEEELKVGFEMNPGWIAMNKKLEKIYEKLGCGGDQDG